MLLAATWQRRRHFFTLINGGPEGTLHRSTDGGKTWKKITDGLPSGTLGRIGLAMSPGSSVVYATVEAATGSAGMYRSSDGGITWEKRSGYTAQPMYYATIFADPFNVQRLYAMDVQNQVSDDSGATWRNLGGRPNTWLSFLWVDPQYDRLRQRQ